MTASPVVNRATNARPTRSSTLGRATVLGLALLPLGNAAAGQSLGLSPDRDLPAWLTQWSPLLVRADLPRRYPGTPLTVIPDAVFGAPRLGLFWTAGNPAGLANDVTDERSDLSVASSQESGDYRRPLDPGRSSLIEARATAWTPVSKRLALLGMVLLDRERLDPGTRSDQAEPYATSPFVTTDTSATAVNVTRARVEGAAGWQLGRWSAGAALGYDSHEIQTVVTGFVRRSRQTMPGISLGASRRIGWMTIAVHGQYRNRAETIDLTERATSGQVVELEGYRNVQPLDISTSFYKRIEENSGGGTVSVAGQWSRVRVVAFGGLGALAEWRTSQQQDDPARDRWSTTSGALGMSAERSLGTEGLIRADIRYLSLKGNGHVALDSIGTGFTAREQLLEGRLETRVLPGSIPWFGAIALSVRSEHRSRNDLADNIETRINGTTTSLSLEVGRRVSERLELTVAVGAGGYVASSSIPNPNLRGAIYQAIIAPEIDFGARAATPYALNGVVRWLASRRTTLWTSARYERLSARGLVGPTAFSRSGSRAAATLMFGASVRPAATAR